MSKFKIQKVEHTAIYNIHNCCIIDYYEKSDHIVQCNFSDEHFARQLCYSNSIGIWRIKSLKNN
jgi:hypothetical protein